MKYITVNDLTTYNKFYNLGLSDADIAALEDLNTSHACKIIHNNAVYYVKKIPGTSNRILAMSLDNSHGLGKAAAMWAAEGTKLPADVQLPVLCFDNNTIFKKVPSADDIENVDVLLTTLGRHNLKIYEDVQQFKDELLATRFRNLDTRLGWRGLELLGSLYWLVGRSSEYNIANFKPAEVDCEVPNYISRILDVLQLPDDTRMAIFLQKEAWFNKRNNKNAFELGIYVTTPEDAQYNLTDPNRFFAFFDNETRLPKVMFSGNPESFPEDENIVRAYRRGRDFLSIDDDTLQIMVKRWARSQQEEAENILVTREIEGKIDKKIKDLSKGTSFSYNDMEFGKNSFKYEKQEFQCSEVDVSEIVKVFSRDVSDQAFNFDNIYEYWIDSIFRTARTIDSNKISGKIGDVEFSVRIVRNEVTRKNGRKVTTEYWYLNEHRINRDEIVPVLNRAVCFASTEEFTDFCASVSSCSLKVHKLVASGLVIKAFDQFLDEHIEFNLEFIRDKSRNFLVIGEDKIPISDTNRLLSIAESDNMGKVIKALMAENITGLSIDQINKVLEVGKKSLVDQKARTKDLLENTLTTLNARFVEDVNLKSGKVMTGYLVNGKRREYFVELKSNRVFEFPSGRYICIVDKGHSVLTGVEALVNRLYALSNDSRLAKEINTL
jgi:hypothetical protein